MKIKDILSIDYPLFFSSLLLTVFGILFIYSSGINSTGELVSTEYIRQIIFAIVGVGFAIFFALGNYRRFYHLAVYFYLGTLLLLLYTCISGREISGSRSWIGVGILGVQPSEFAKIATIVFLAWYLDISRHSATSLSRFLTACAIVFTPMFLVLIQPDFGTSLVFIPILLLMTFISGIRLRYIMFMIITVAITSILLLVPFWEQYVLKLNIPGLMMLGNGRFIAAMLIFLALIFFAAFYGLSRFRKNYFYWICYVSFILAAALVAEFGASKMLKQYQISRLVVFIDPYVDPQGAGWHIIQSVTAIGSGGALGKGFLQGTQSHYRFLPTQSTDFIFSIFSEEWGFLGGILLFALFTIICFRIISIMRTTADLFGAYISAGLVAVFGFHFLINVGMAMGIMPITGIPLPFMSYGGSALIASMCGIGIAISIYIRRYEF